MNHSWLYLSHSLCSEAPAYGGCRCFSGQTIKSMDQGDSCNTSSWSLSSHSGTHIDFPAHFSRHGLRMDDYEAGYFVFEHVFCIDLEPTVPGIIIGPESLRGVELPEDTELLLIKTGFGSFREKDVYWQENPGFHPSLAEELRNKLPLLKVLGFDSLSISSFAHRDLGREAHKAFLDHPRPILLLEDMDLSLICSDTVIEQVVVAPLRVSGADGSPCTVLARVVQNKC